MLTGDFSGRGALVPARAGHPVQAGAGVVVTVAARGFGCEALFERRAIGAPATLVGFRFGYRVVATDGSDTDLRRVRGGTGHGAALG